MRHNFKNLKIWNLSMEITDDIYKLISLFPKFERYSLGNQMTRCAVSMPSNIAEGTSRGEKQFKYFLDISLGSSFELQTQLLIAFKNKYITEEQLLQTEKKIIEFQKMMTSFINRLESSLKS